MVTQAADGLRRLVEGAPPPGDPNGLAQAQASDESLQGLIQALPDATPLGLVLGFAGDEILQALEGHPEAAAILEMALDGGVLSDPLLVARLRDEVLQFFYRVPVGDRLR